jgi:hypothetical protein
VIKVARLSILRQTKSFLKSTFPRGAHAYGKVKDYSRDILLRGRDVEAIFSEIYERNLWNDPRVSFRPTTTASAEHVLFDGRRVYPFKFLLKHYPSDHKEMEKRRSSANGKPDGIQKMSYTL